MFLVFIKIGNKYFRINCFSPFVKGQISYRINIILYSPFQIKMRDKYIGIEVDSDLPISPEPLVSGLWGPGEVIAFVCLYVCMSICQYVRMSECL